MNLTNRILTTIPNWANPYNKPNIPQLYQPPCSQFSSIGTIYHTRGGVFGNCSIKNRTNPALPPYDFVCPKGRICTSQTSALVGDTPDKLCCGMNGYQTTSSGPVNESVDIWKYPEIVNYNQMFTLSRSM